jgi:hypothetical protein
MIYLYTSNVPMSSSTSTLTRTISAGNRDG